MSLVFTSTCSWVFQEDEDLCEREEEDGGDVCSGARALWVRTQLFGGFLTLGMNLMGCASRLDKEQHFETCSRNPVEEVKMGEAPREKVTVIGSYPHKTHLKIRCESVALLIHCFETALSNLWSRFPTKSSPWKWGHRFCWKREGRKGHFQRNVMVLDSLSMIFSLERLLDNKAW